MILIKIGLEVDKHYLLKALVPWNFLKNVSSICAKEKLICKPTSLSMIFIIVLTEKMKLKFCIQIYYTVIARVRSVRPIDKLNSTQTQVKNKLFIESKCDCHWLCNQLDTVFVFLSFFFILGLFRWCIHGPFLSSSYHFILAQFLYLIDSRTLSTYTLTEFLLSRFFGLSNFLSVYIYYNIHTSSVNEH